MVGKRFGNDEFEGVEMDSETATGVVDLLQEPQAKEPVVAVAAGATRAAFETALHGGGAVVILNEDRIVAIGLKANIELKSDPPYYSSRDLPIGTKIRLK